MTRSAWWKYLWVWSLPGVLVIVNLLWVFVLRQTLLGRGANIDEQLREKEREVRELEKVVSELESAKAKLAQLQQELVELREREMGSMRERLVPFLTTVGERVRKTGLFPERISYSANQDKKSGLVHFTATFEITGSYQQLRQCIGELEQVPQFLVIERLAMQGDDVARSTDISLRMVVGTYFSDLDPELLRQVEAQEKADAAL